MIIIKRKAYLLHKKLKKRLKKHKYNLYENLDKKFQIKMTKKYNCDIGLILDYMNNDEKQYYIRISKLESQESYNASKIIGKYIAITGRNDIIFSNYDELSWKRRKNKNSKKI